jgi:hypothetical protein
MVVKEKKRKEPHFIVSQQFKVAQPYEQNAFLISSDDWGRIKKECLRIRPYHSVFNNIGFASIGLAGSAFFAALTSSEVITSSKMIFWALFLVFIITAILSFYYSHLQRRDTITSTNDILEDMECIEKKYTNQK